MLCPVPEDLQTSTLCCPHTQLMTPCLALQNQMRQPFRGPRSIDIPDPSHLMFLITRSFTGPERARSTGPAAPVPGATSAAPAPSTDSSVLNARGGRSALRIAQDEGAGTVRCQLHGSGNGCVVHALRRTLCCCLWCDLWAGEAGMMVFASHLDSWLD